MWPACTFIFLCFYQSASAQLSLLTTNQILEENHGKKQVVQSAKHTSTDIIGQFLVSTTQKRPQRASTATALKLAKAAAAAAGGEEELSTHSSKQLPNKCNLRRQDTRSTRPQTWLVWGETLLTVTKLTQRFSSAGKRAVSFSQPALQSCFLFVCCHKHTTKQRVEPLFPKRC